MESTQKLVDSVLVCLFSALIVAGRTGDAYSATRINDSISEAENLVLGLTRRGYANAEMLAQLIQSAGTEAGNA